MNRLSSINIDALPATVAVPGYNRAARGLGIVHLGIGAFHRAHQAVYTDRVLATGDGDWMICGVSLRGPGVRDQLAPQDGLYTVVEKSGTGNRLQVIGAVKEVLFAPEDPAKVLARMADPTIRIVSLTITEKGYYRDPASGALLLGEDDIARDIANLDRPCTALGYLVSALARRRAAGTAPFTVLSCDNLPDNGHATRAVVVQMARQVDAGLADWIERNVTFPCTMVDRIVPATTDADRDGLTTAAGLRDEAMVVGEPFTQWVIEDNFAAGRPAWENAGALLVTDVRPYELMKLRLLNGPHSALAAYAASLMRGEIAPTLQPPDGYDLGGYIDQLLDRFANPALQHRTWQIAMDGSQKLPQRLLGTAADRLDAGQSIPLIALALAAWIRYVCGRDESGQAIDVRDPLADTLRAAIAPHFGDAAAMVEAALAIDAVFGTDLPRRPAFRAALIAALAGIRADGTAATLAVTMEGRG